MLRLGVVILPEHRWPIARAISTSAIRSRSRELLTLDDVSGGRFTLGIGAGGTGWDATILGRAEWPPRGAPLASSSSSVSSTDFSASERRRTRAGSTRRTRRGATPAARSSRASPSRSRRPGRRALRPRRRTPRPGSPSAIARPTAGAGARRACASRSRAAERVEAGRERARSPTRAPARASIRASSRSKRSARPRTLCRRRSHRLRRALAAARRALRRRRREVRRRSSREAFGRGLERRGKRALASGGPFDLTEDA